MICLAAAHRFKVSAFVTIFDDEDLTALAAVESADELHHVAARFNWDCLGRQFASKTIRIDPHNLFGHDAVAYYERHVRDGDRFRVPEAMTQPSPGTDLPLDELRAEA
jgi:hypothetical protein